MLDHLHVSSRLPPEPVIWVLIYEDDMLPFLLRSLIILCSQVGGFYSYRKL
jgi:hypothetical protein